jgi:hypothetical protein
MSTWMDDEAGQGESAGTGREFVYYRIDDGGEGINFNGARAASTMEESQPNDITASHDVTA